MDIHDEPKNKTTQKFKAKVRIWDSVYNEILDEGIFLIDSRDSRANFMPFS